MIDFDVNADLRPEPPFASDEELRPARDQLMTAIAAERPLAGCQAPAGWRRPAAVLRGTRPGRRLALAAGVSVVAAAAVAAALVASPAAAPGTGPAVAGHAPVRHASVAVTRFLSKAATAALRLPAGAPRPGQFVYVETELANGVRTQYWISADGSRHGLVKPTSPPGGNGVQPACTLAQAEGRRGCFPEAGYFPDMPASPAALDAFLNKVKITSTGSGGTTDWKANDIGKAVDELMWSAYLLPAQRAALYQLMSRTPGFSIAHGVSDAVHRTGTAVEWTYEGARTAIIFDPVTYAYLGDRSWRLSGTYAGQTDASALLKVAIVNKAGQLP
jgi:hypothetical protein